jgi:hypothetical protein
MMGLQYRTYTADNYCQTVNIAIRRLFPYAKVANDDVPNH